MRTALSDSNSVGESKAGRAVLKSCYSMAKIIHVDDFMALKVTWMMSIALR